MIGLVEIRVNNIVKAYKLLMEDEELKNTQGQFEKRVDHLRDIIEHNAGRKKSNFFRHSKENYIKVNTLLEELVYASKLSATKTMLVRVEMASLIQDILRHYDELETGDIK